MEEQEQEQIATLPTVEESPTEETTIQRTKDVKTFWQRLDEVFQMNVESAQLRERMENLLEQFPEYERASNKYSSFLFQPERIVISSNDDIVPPNVISERYIIPLPTTTVQSSFFNSFRVKLKRALVNVKSIQMLSATLPNAIQNIPNNSVYFFYYRLRNITQSERGPFDPVLIYDAGDIVLDNLATQAYVMTQTTVLSGIIPGTTYWLKIGYQTDVASLSQWSDAVLYNVGDRVIYQGDFYICVVPKVGVIPGVTYWQPITEPADLTSPNYYDIYNENALQYVLLTPTTVLPEYYANNSALRFNRTFNSYSDLLESINYCATLVENASTPNDVTFQYSDVLNRFVFQPLDIAAGYYYFPAGYQDTRISAYLENQAQLFNVDWFAQYTLNLRMGFTWNGLFPDIGTNDPWVNDDVANALYNYMRPIDPRFINAPYNLQPWAQNVVTANSYGDLVNTSCVRVYADVTLASTQDTNNLNVNDAEGLLSVVPVNTTNLGVGFYQNNFNNELTKIPSIITEIGIRLVNDQGLPFWLPNSATCLIELSITYK